MANENETVADIVKRVRRDCNSYPLRTATAEMLKLVRDMDAAHQRAVAELKRRLKVAEDALEKITTGCFSHKDGDKPIVQVIIDIASKALFAIREEGGVK